MKTEKLESLLTHIKEITGTTRVDQAISVIESTRRDLEASRAEIQELCEAVGVAHKGCLLQKLRAMMASQLEYPLRWGQASQRKVYIYTTRTAREKGVYKVGGTEKEVASARINEQDSTACWEPLEEVWSSEFLTDVSDGQVREKLLSYGLQYQRIDKRREWVTSPEWGETLNDETLIALTRKAITEIEKNLQSLFITH